MSAFDYTEVEEKDFDYDIVTDNKEVEKELNKDSKIELDKNVQYIVGYENNTFLPNNKMTRQEVATILYQIIKDIDKTKKTYNTKSFKDVDESLWSYNYINYVHELGLVNGYYDGTFKPNKNITRGEFAKIISSFFEVTSTKSNLTDIDGHWAKSFIQTCVANEIMVGYPDNTFRPENEITRAEVIVTINRLLGVSIDEKYLDTIGNKFTDLDKNHWAYYHIIHASSKVNN